ncbi:MAG: glutamine synthetase III [Cytophagales bacterium]|nr:glutamine synthetase III [Cytophagales bacterium]MDW8384266.1 glutamine synthetase III [Flammeovirgaceae bacterium]
MANLRLRAIEEIANRKVVRYGVPGKASEYYGENCFSLDKMKATLAPAVFKKVKQAIETGSKLDLETAEAIASAVKSWAVNKGVTHYTHWFQPLTGLSAEKHDAFFSYLSGIEGFSGKQLIQQEPDGSSFPSGGIRRTNEARGYTIYDPSSPIFIMDTTLYIPTAFVSYTGETLDYKTPLLKSLNALNKAAVAVCKYFDDKVNYVYATLGPEQEYFLIDKAFAALRPDLVLTGRTVYGAAPAKGQQLEDQYFGSIPGRVLEFMKELEVECLKVGIPVTTRHNEVAPSQYEIAPLFEEINVAVDHNLLMMEIMRKVADRHNFFISHHEKPFAKVNGSGKHNNWSITTNTGRNLLEPQNDLYFLTFLVNVIKAVHENADLLRASIASAANDYRLGANEAPPAIMSIFLGETLTKVLDEFEATGKFKLDEKKNYMQFGISRLPDAPKDNTDRNRTSPFAFTGNKFEYRAVGGSANCGTAMMVLNMIVADQLTKFKAEVDALIKSGKKKNDAILEVCLEYVKSSKAIRFDGDGYSEEWKKEAARRGLKNIPDTPDALDFFIEKKYEEMFERHGVFNKRELHARYEIWQETYAKKVDIETKLMEELAMTSIIPAAMAYLNELCTTMEGLKAAGADKKEIADLIKEIAHLVGEVKERVEAMRADRLKAEAKEGTAERAKAFCHEVKHKHHEKLREAVDKLETLVADEFWPLPKYREMLFMR